MIDWLDEGVSDETSRVRKESYDDQVDMADLLYESVGAVQKWYAAQGSHSNRYTWKKNK